MISQAAGFLDDPEGLCEVLDAGGPAGRGSPSSRVVPVRIARPAAAAGRRLIAPPTPIPGIRAGQGYPTKVSQDYRDPVHGGRDLGRLLPDHRALGRTDLHP